MGGGDLNMKKSWHPLLLKNQERVWLEEKKALEEKKKLEQLRKEKEEERQLQELQRLQEEQTGKKRTEKLEWMYATPATGSSQNPNDLEDYLLGKKRVDKILTADENAKLGALHKNFIAVQNANSARDISAKIREDPLLAIKQQEQAAYQALISNPLRLREMQGKHGILPRKAKKEERKREKEERRRLRHERKQRKSRDSSRSPRDAVAKHDVYRSDPHAARDRYSPGSSVERHKDYHRQEPRRRSSPGYSRGRESFYLRESRETFQDERSSRPGWRRGHSPARTESGSLPHHRDDRRELYSRRRSRSPLPSRRPFERPRSDRSPRSSRTDERDGDKIAEERAARLAAMTSNASSMAGERQQRLALLLEKEKAELDGEERARAASKGMASFISAEHKKMYGGMGGLEDRLRRDRNGLALGAD